MKRVYILWICCFILVLSIAGCKPEEDSDSRAVQEKIDAENTTVIIEDLELQVPSLWTIHDHTMLFENMPVLAIESNDFDESRLKQEFQYETTEECIRSFLPNGVYPQSNGAIVREINGFVIYEFACTADKYSETEDMFAESEDIVYLEYIVQPDKNRIHCLYFMHDMAEQDEINSFLKNIQIAETNSEDRDGQYRWMIDD